MENKIKKANSLNTWIECESKNRPGKKYLFNTATGERQWKTPESLSIEKPPNKVVSPAKERLKRLQTEIQKPDKKCDTKASKNSRSQKIPPIKKATAAVAFTTPKDRLKILQGQASKERLKNEPLVATHASSKSTFDTDTETRKRRFNSVVEPKPIAKSRCLTVPVGTKEEAVLKIAHTPKDRLTILQNKAIRKSFKNVPPQTSSKNIIPPKSGICKGATEVQKQIVNPSKSVEIKKNLPETNTQKRTTPKANKSITEKLSNIKDPQSRLESISKLKKGLLKTANTSPLSTQKPKTSQIDETKFLDLKFLTETPKRSQPLKRLNFSANKRLENFRKSLVTENRVTEQKCLFPQKSINNNLEDETMDWEPIEEPIVSWPNSLNSPALHNSALEDVTDMEVDDNLMLNAAEESKEIHKLDEKWLRGFIYVVLDTNVFIDHLSFIEQLKAKKFNRVADLILYIPYSVLQELDKLKLRQDIKRAVVRAIRFLNNMFEEKNKFIQAQSAIEECRHLIDVQSADDSILNCCLQVQANIPNVILLSEDVNLRNKAICNNIQTSTTADLLEKQLIRESWS